ncbi:hypothetical protein BHE74_00036510 [Ensete ventricosum]|nr:hypothetical protein BHE74_00036510 [Ensete ventricosum]
MWVVVHAYGGTLELVLGLCQPQPGRTVLRWASIACSLDFVLIKRLVSPPCDRRSWLAGPSARRRHRFQWRCWVGLARDAVDARNTLLQARRTNAAASDRRRQLQAPAAYIDAAHGSIYRDGDAIA